MAVDNIRLGSHMLQFCKSSNTVGSEGSSVSSSSLTSLTLWPSSRGRTLEQKKRLKHAKCCNPEGKSIGRDAKQISGSTGNHLDHAIIRTSEGFVDAFRPTNPGHSPGVGHSIHN
uniref:Uncharacterized protein n=1 Tax=Salix viminalis TaxID=40686 RepID=A0A6N2NK16_SALVM